MTEERMDDRLKKELGVARRSRGMDDRQVTENRAVSDDERLEMFRMQMHNDALPDLPNLPGFHVCWLTTTNPRDPIHRRMQLGYEPVKPEEVPGLEFATQKTGEWVGFIAVNEMLAFKLPESLYQAFMKEAHYDAPLREENKLAETAEIMREQAERSGSRLIEGDGMEDMRLHAPTLSDFS
jgi:hypothetical protein